MGKLRVTKPIPSIKGVSRLALRSQNWYYNDEIFVVEQWRVVAMSTRRELLEVKECSSRILLLVAPESDNTPIQNLERSHTATSSLLRYRPNGVRSQIYFHQKSDVLYLKCRSRNGIVKDKLRETTTALFVLSSSLSENEKMRMPAVYNLAIELQNSHYSDV